MTISEQLQFSVLTAPVATIDRRALSQAWYSALYGSGNAPARVKAKCAVAGTAQIEKNIAQPVYGVEPAKSRVSSSPVLRETCAQPTEAPPLERRAKRSALARKIERAFLHPRSASHKASFSVEGEQGRVHVVLQTRGTRLKLVAICPPKARANVAAALAQARYALALRGIDLDAQTRGVDAC